MYGYPDKGDNDDEIIILITTTTIIWRFGPFSGHSLPAAGVYKLLSLYEARMSAPRQPLRGGPVYLSLSGTTLKTRPAARMPPTDLPISLVHTSFVTLLNMPSIRWRYLRRRPNMTGITKCRRFFALRTIYSIYEVCKAG